MDSFVNIRESLGKAVAAPLIAYRARQLSEAVVQENDSPSEGIFYVWRKPSGWDVFPLRFDEFGEMDHSELWEQYLAPMLATLWSPVLKKPKPSLEKSLMPLVYGFPRGRISKRNRTYLVLNGGDFDKFASKSHVERAFSLSNVCKWEPDEHERCQAVDRDAIRQVLKLKETWKAV